MVLWLLTTQPPIQLNSLTGTYATSTYLAALKKSPKELESLAKDVETFDQKIKTDEKVSAFIGMLDPGPFTEQKLMRQKTQH
jgi:hypothetical protein